MARPAARELRPVVQGWSLGHDSARAGAMAARLRIRFKLLMRKG
jgi:hypothetical protein